MKKSMKFKLFILELFCIILFSNCKKDPPTKEYYNYCTVTFIVYNDYGYRFANSEFELLQDGKVIQSGYTNSDGEYKKILDVLQEYQFKSFNSSRYMYKNFVLDGESNELTIKINWQEVD